MKRKKKFWVVGATVAVAVAVTLGMTTTGCSFKSKGTSKTSDYVAEDVKNKIITFRILSQTDDFVLIKLRINS